MENEQEEQLQEHEQLVPTPDPLLPLLLLDLCTQL
jgi:hypothetical protein